MEDNKKRAVKLYFGMVILVGLFVTFDLPVSGNDALFVYPAVAVGCALIAEAMFPRDES